MKSTDVQTSELLSVAQTWMQPVKLVIDLLLVAWIIWILVNAVLSFLSMPPQPALDPVEVNPLHLHTDTDKQLIADLPGWHLFGEATQATTAVEIPEPPPDAPDTQLKLVLRGILDSGSPLFSRAIIADAQGREDSYAIGDLLPGDAELREIYVTRVILRHAGRYETLRLPRSETGELRTRLIEVAVPRPVQAKTADSAHQAAIHDLPHRKPQSLAQMLTIQRKKDPAGRDVGFLLYPGVDAGFFERVGLHAGDELIEINHQPMDTPANLWRGLQSAKSGDSVAMTILRGNRQQQLSFTLPK